MLNNLLKLLDSLTTRLRTIVISKNLSTPASRLLYETAKGHLGQDASPLDKAPDEFACAESVNAIHQKTFGEPIGGDISTYRMYYALLNHKKFAQVTIPLPGDVILSPSGIGGGKNGIISGHVGICGEEGKIMSNNSKDGKWDDHFDLFSWRYRYSTLGGFRVLFFRRIII